MATRMFRSEALAAVQTGDLTAQEAGDLVVDGLQNELGDEIIIR